MGQANLDEFGAADAGIEPLREYLEKEAVKYISGTFDDFDGYFDGQLSDSAQQGMTREQKEHFIETIRKALATGIWGWVDDDMASVGDWGFDLAGIEVPVAIWHGGKDDMFIPSAHGEWLAENVPGATLSLRPDEDHFSLSKYLGEVLDGFLAEG